MCVLWGCFVSVAADFRPPQTLRPQGDQRDRPTWLLICARSCCDREAASCHDLRSCGSHSKRLSEHLLGAKNRCSRRRNRHFGGGLCRRWSAFSYQYELTRSTALILLRRLMMEGILRPLSCVIPSILLLPFWRRRTMLPLSPIWIVIWTLATLGSAWVVGLTSAERRGPERNCPPAAILAESAGIVFLSPFS
jgi:hypothetical protein